VAVLCRFITQGQIESAINRSPDCDLILAVDDASIELVWSALANHRRAVRVLAHKEIAGWRGAKTG